MKSMKLWLVVALIGMTATWSCTDNSVSLDTSQQQAVVDSLIEVHAVALRDSVEQSCKSRMDGEVAAKADSVFKVSQKK